LEPSRTIIKSNGGASATAAITFICNSNNGLVYLHQPYFAFTSPLEYHEDPAGSYGFWLGRHPPAIWSSNYLHKATPVVYAKLALIFCEGKGFSLSSEIWCIGLATQHNLFRLPKLIRTDPLEQRKILLSQGQTQS
jgi:hypothetical protein